MSEGVEPSSFEGLQAWRETLALGLMRATAGASRRIYCLDPDFASWPFAQPELYPSLVAWLKQPGRELILIAANFDGVASSQPRLTRWRQDWVHVVHGRLVPQELQPQLPSALVDEQGVVVRLVEPQCWRGLAAYGNKAQSTPWLDRALALLERSEPGFAVHTLGL